MSLLNRNDLDERFKRLEKIIRAYDIRGIVPDNLNEQDAFVLGIIFATYWKKLCKNITVLVGMDNRTTSFGLANALTAGFNLCGVLVRHLGTIHTPFLYYNAYQKKNILGIMITASHNPIEYNGFKVVFNSRVVNGSEILSILNHVRQDLNLQEQGMSDYIQYLFNKTSLSALQDISVLWDCNHGATQNVIFELVTHLCNQNTVIDVDKHISTQPDPATQSNIGRIKEIVLNYDIAFCFDGDGDRLLVITKNGQVLRGDRILLVIAEYLAKDYSGSAIVVDIKTSNMIIQRLKAIGFQVIVERTGHAFIKESMLQNQALLGGEISGHLFFNFSDNSFASYDDSILAACYLLKILFIDKNFIFNVIQKLPQTFSKYDIKIYCSDDQQNNVLKFLKSDLIKKNHKFIEIDGIKCEHDDGWWLVRKSNTESALIVCIEGNDHITYEKYKLYIQTILNSFNIAFNA